MENSPVHIHKRRPVWSSKGRCGCRLPFQPSRSHIWDYQKLNWRIGCNQVWFLPISLDTPDILTYWILSRWRWLSIPGGVSNLISSRSHTWLHLFNQDTFYLCSRCWFNTPESNYPAHICKKYTFHVLVCWPVIHCPLKQDAMEEYSALKDKKRVRVNSLIK